MSKRTSREARRRALAQNLLVDDSVIAALVNQLNPRPDSLVVDLGAGRGALTEPVARLCRRTIAVERDPRLVDHLRRKSPGWGGIEVRSADILKVPFPAEPHLLISNAPYNIGTALLRRVLAEAHGMARGVFVLQLETARRLAGSPSSGLFASTWAPWFRIELGRTIGPPPRSPRMNMRGSSPRSCRKGSLGVDAVQGSSRTTRQGLPNARTPGGTSRVTMLPAPITESSPIVTPGQTITPAPIQTPSSIVTGRFSSMP